VSCKWSVSLSGRTIGKKARLAYPEIILKIAGIASVLTFFSFSPRIGMAVGQECMHSYYRTKSSACIDEILADFRQRPQFDPNTLIGLLAELFRTSPQERGRILKAEPSDQLKAIALVSLYRAGLPDEAEKFANASNLSALADKTRAMHLPTLDAVKPSVPADNDLLVGAYMASGEPTFIQRILATYSDADDGMVSDGLRIGFMLSKFGPTLAAKGRNAVTTQVACEKYQCKSDPTKLLRVLTLATALWSLQSLSQQDDGIKGALTNFFAGDTRLKTLFLIEQNAFANYLTMIIGLAGVPNDAVMNKSAEMYEKLVSANEAFAPLTNSKK
jgi:hypothetical protein